MTKQNLPSADLHRQNRDQKIAEHRREMDAEYRRGMAASAATDAAVRQATVAIADAPTEPIDIEQMWTAEPASKELEPIKTYDPDNDWRKRAWQLDGRDEWEQWAMAALKLRHVNALVDSVDELLKSPEWDRVREPSNRARVFRFYADIIAKAGVL